MNCTAAIATTAKEHIVLNSKTIPNYNSAKDKKIISRARFNQAEDEIIKNCVENYGPSWLKHAVNFLGEKHSERAIRERYKNYIDLKQKRVFTPEEDEKIFMLKNSGKSFREIAQVVSNTSAQHIRIRFNKIQRKLGILPSRRKYFEIKIDFQHKTPVSTSREDHINYDEVFHDFVEDFEI